MRLIILIFSLTTLSACASNLQQLELAAPESNNFSSALAAEYQAYASSENEQGRSGSSEYFASKGVQALYGGDVPLEMVPSSLPDSAQRQMQATREMLATLLVDDVKRVVPQPAARAQLLFDCWARTYTRSAKEAGVCADELEPMIDTLQSVAVTVNQGLESEYDVVFASGSSALSSDIKTQVKTIGELVRANTAYTIEIQGQHGTRAGKKLFNRRFIALRAALVAQGVLESRIEQEDVHGSKAVYLSSDKKMKDSNQIQITVRTFGANASEQHP